MYYGSYRLVLRAIPQTSSFFFRKPGISDNIIQAFPQSLFHALRLCFFHRLPNSFGNLIMNNPNETR